MTRQLAVLAQVAGGILVGAGLIRMYLILVKTRERRRWEEKHPGLNWSDHHKG